MTPRYAPAKEGRRITKGTRMRRIDKRRVVSAYKKIGKWPCWGITRYKNHDAGVEFCCPFSAVLEAETGRVVFELCSVLDRLPEEENAYMQAFIRAFDDPIGHPPGKVQGTEDGKRIREFLENDARFAAFHKLKGNMHHASGSACLL